MSQFVFIFILFLSLLNNAAAQNWQLITKTAAVKELEQANNWFREHKKYSVAVTHTSYVGYENPAPHEQFPGFMIQDGIYFHSRLIGIETFQNESYNLTVDSENRVIFISNPKNVLSSILDFSDSSSLRYISACYINKSGQQKILRLDYKPGHKLEREEIVFDNENKLKQVNLFFVEEKDDGTAFIKSNDLKPKVIILYSDYSLNPDLSVFEFSTDKYLIANEDKFVLTSAYKNYRLLDIRIKQK